MAATGKTCRLNCPPARGILTIFLRIFLPVGNGRRRRVDSSGGTARDAVGAVREPAKSTWAGVGFGNSPILHRKSRGPQKRGTALQAMVSPCSGRGHVAHGVAMGQGPPTQFSRKPRQGRSPAPFARVHGAVINFMGERGRSAAGGRPSPGTPDDPRSVKGWRSADRRLCRSIARAPAQSCTRNSVRDTNRIDAWRRAKT